MIKTLHKELNYQVLHLVSWPSLGQLLDDTAVDITRICALLARRPSVGMLIPVMLDISPQQTFSLLKSLHASGNIRPGIVADLDEAAQPESQPFACHECAAHTSFIAKLWLRLKEKS